MDEQIAQKLDAFFTKFKHQTYKKGEMLIRADEDPLGIFYLTKGTVRQYIISKKGDELVVNIFKPISFFPMSWAVNSEKNMYFYEALDTVEVYRAPKDMVIEFVKNNTDVLYNLLQRVYKGVEGLLTRTTYLMSGSAYSRLVTELIILAKRFGVHEENKVTIKTTEKDLASETGMTRETISREIKLLKEKKLIEFSTNKLIIHDLKRLENELAEDF